MNKYLENCTQREQCENAILPSHEIFNIMLLWHIPQTISQTMGREVRSNVLMLLQAASFFTSLPMLTI